MKTKKIVLPVIALMLCSMRLPEKIKLKQANTRGLIKTDQVVKPPKTAQGAKNTRPTSPILSTNQLFRPTSQIDPPSNNPKEIRQKLVQRFEKATEQAPKDFNTAQRVVEMLTSMDDESRTLGQCLKTRLMHFRTVGSCMTQIKTLKVRIAAIQQENTLLQQQRKQAEEARLASQAEVPESVQELQQELVQSKEKIKKQEAAAEKIVAQTKELPELENIKERTLKELGQKALDKMIAGRPLIFSDIDTGAHLFRLVDPIRFDSETGLFRTKNFKQEPSERDVELPDKFSSTETPVEQQEEPLLPEQELMQLKLGLAKALEDNKELKKELEEKKQTVSIQDIPRMPSEIAGKPILSVRAEGENVGILGAMGMNIFMNKLRSRFTLLFGNAAASMLLDLRLDVSIDVLSDAIDKNTPLMQQLLGN